MINVYFRSTRCRVLSPLRLAAMCAVLPLASAALAADAPAAGPQADAPPPPPAAQHDAMSQPPAPPDADGPDDRGPGGPGGPAADDRAAVTVDGTVTSYNRDPHGMYNGINLKLSDGRAAQLNLPPHLATSAASMAAVGAAVHAKAVAEVNLGDRTIYRLISLSTQDGKQLSVPDPRHPQTAHVSGTVAQLNYAPRGEVDGALLDSGDFVHLNPMAAAQAQLAVGQKIDADGIATPMSDGHQAIEATTLNGTALPQPPHPPGRFGPGGRRGPGGPGGLGGPSGPGGSGGPGGRGDGPDGMGGAQPDAPAPGTNSPMP